LAAALIAAGLLGLWSCAEERPTQPGPKRYVIYADCTGWRDPAWTPGLDSTLLANRLYVYDAQTVQLLDSVVMDRWSSEMAVSPDGRYLYRASAKLPSGQPGDGGRLEKWNARTWRQIWSVPAAGAGGICLLKNGELLLLPIAPSSDGPVPNLLRTEDGQPVDWPDPGLDLGWGPVEGTKVAAHTDGGNTVSVVDVLTGDVYGSWTPTLRGGGTIGIGDPVLLPDGHRVAVIGWHSGNYGDSWFLVGDVLTGETLMEQWLWLAAGRISFSPDGRMALVSDPPQWLIFDTPGSLSLIDLQRLETVSRADFGMYWAQFVPGEDFAVGGAIAFPGPFTGGGFFRLPLSDLSWQNREVIWFPWNFSPEGDTLRGGAFLGGLAVGPAP
jgi:hypothetical protein